jgi:uncharacterized repeat protein (TIGR03803 family)
VKRPYSLAAAFLGTTILAACGGGDGLPPSVPNAGAPSNTGPLFVRPRTSSVEQVIYSFKGLLRKDGSNPEASLISVNGTLYGTTNYGGRDTAACSEYLGCGTVFSVSTSGTEKVIYAFKGSPDGKNTSANLANVNGALYGTTYNGGSCGSSCDGTGTVFKVDASTGKENPIYSFQGANAGDGSNPAAGVIPLKGTLYGTTMGGGICDPYCGFGTVYSISTSGVEHDIHSFTGGGYYKAADGGYPNAGLIAVKGTLYGTTTDGGGTDCAEGSGSTGCGTVYKVSPASGSESVLYGFKYGAKDGAYPSASLIDVKGTLYGTTVGGGAHACVGDNSRGCGTVFAVSTSGKERVLYSFKGGADGWNPFSTLAYANGILYGTTEAGGGSGCNGYGCGTVFEVGTTGKGYRVLYSFAGGADGQDPLAGVIYSSGKLYGTTYQGGAGDCTNGCGTIFAVTP